LDVLITLNALMYIGIKRNIKIFPGLAIGDKCSCGGVLTLRLYQSENEYGDKRIYKLRPFETFCSKCRPELNIDRDCIKSIILVNRAEG